MYTNAYAAIQGSGDIIPAHKHRTHTQTMFRIVPRLHAPEEEALHKSAERALACLHTEIRAQCSRDIESAYCSPFLYEHPTLRQRVRVCRVCVLESMRSSAHLMCALSPSSSGRTSDASHFPHQSRELIPTLGRARAVYAMQKGVHVVAAAIHFGFCVP